MSRLCWSNKKSKLFHLMIFDQVLKSSERCCNISLYSNMTRMESDPSIVHSAIKKYSTKLVYESEEYPTSLIYGPKATGIDVNVSEPVFLLILHAWAQKEVIREITYRGRFINKINQQQNRVFFIQRTFLFP